MTNGCLKMRLWAATLLIAAPLLASCTENEDRTSILEDPKFNVEGTLDFLRPDGSVIVRIAVELAESPEEQAIGLMRRRSLPGRGGMLFVYAQPQDQRFWMKNTPMPLDILFIADDSSIVNIVEGTIPLSEQSIESDGPAQYVLELRAGFVGRYGIDETTRIRWQRT